MPGKVIICVLIWAVCDGVGESVENATREASYVFSGRSEASITRLGTRHPPCSYYSDRGQSHLPP
jgi:hypothetical protein